jgi:hypothetical protein
MVEELTADCGGDNDKRILMRKILNGEISKKKLERYISELPDVSSCAEEVVIE